MAEIKVEPKRGGLGWLWAIIGLVLVAAVVWYFMSDSMTTTPATTSPADTVGTSVRDVPTTALVPEVLYG